MAAVIKFKKSCDLQFIGDTAFCCRVSSATWMETPVPTMQYTKATLPPTRGMSTTAPYRNLPPPYVAYYGSAPCSAGPISLHHDIKPYVIRNNKEFAYKALNNKETLHIFLIL